MTLRTDWISGARGHVAEHNEISEILNSWYVMAFAYGAKGDGVTDDTVALQNALDTGKVVWLGEGDYLITDTLVSQTSGQFIIGTAIDRTRLVWGVNDNTKDMVKFVDTRYFGLRDLSIVSSSTNKARSGVLITHTGTETTAEGSFRNVLVTGSAATGMVYGYYITGTVACDMLSWVDGKVAYCTRGIYSTNNQSRLWYFHTMQFLLCTYGIATENGFTAYNMWFFGNTGSDIYMTNAWTEPVVLCGGQSDSSARLFESAGASGYTSSVVIDSFNYLSNAINVDKIAILHSFSGELVVRNTKFGGDGSNSEILINSDYGFVHLQGCTIRRDSATHPIVSRTSLPKFWMTNCRRMSNTTTYSILNDVKFDNLFVAFTADDATPSVEQGNLFKTANVNPTTVTTFDNAASANGQHIVVIIGDAVTTIDFSGTNLKGNAGVDWTPAAGDWLEAYFDGTNWYCSCHDTTL